MASEPRDSGEPTLDELLNDLWINPPPHPRSNRTRAAIIDRDARIRAALEAGMHESIAEAQRGYVARLAEMIKKSDALIAKAEAERDQAIAERDDALDDAASWEFANEQAEAERDAAIARAERAEAKS